MSTFTLRLDKELPSGMQIAANATGFEGHDKNVKSAIKKYTGSVKLINCCSVHPHPSH